MINKKLLLIVEDEKDMAEIIKLRLEANGYSVILAEDGQEGLEKAKKEKPDLIVLDIMLPKMDGYKVCGLLKSNYKYAKIPIILFTARAQDKDKEMAKEVGANAYITKPFDPEQLLKKIGELLKGDAT
jgi:DNA-binding response OmpR family regulator